MTDTVTHEHLRDRLQTLEKTSADMRNAQTAVATHVQHLDGRVAETAMGVKENREYSEEKFQLLQERQNEAYIELTDHRSEFRGLRTGMWWGLSVIGAIATLGVSIMIALFNKLVGS